MGLAPDGAESATNSANSIMIYLDHSATTPIRPEVAEAMAPYAAQLPGNPGSIHAAGRAARKAMDDARDHVAALINADPRDIIFTSGGTEADNLAIAGVFAASPRDHIVVSAVDHHAVVHTAEYLKKYQGARVTVLPAKPPGAVSTDGLEELLKDNVAIASVMAGNNETGVIQPFRQIGLACRQAGVPFHTDAVQAVAMIPIDLIAMPIDLLSMSAHKFGGPKGVGALYVKRGIDIAPQQWGGAQEKNRRAGTENVAAIVGMGKACEIALREREETYKRLAALRDRLEEGICAMGGVTVNGVEEERLPHISNLRFEGIEGESVLLALDVEGVAVSTGSACTSGSLDPSHVLLAMGQDYATARSAVRFSLGPSNTAEEIEQVIGLMPTILDRLRNAAPLTPQH